MALEKKIKWLFTLVVLANLVIVLMVILGALEPAPPKPMPNPNGYEDFVKAGTLVKDNAGDYSTLKPAELAALVATNAKALKLLRVGLTRECRAPDDYSLHYFDRVLPEFASQKKLALNLCAEGRLAKMENRTNDAAQSFLDAIRFSQQCSQGGVIISKLVGIACENLGRAGLQTLTNGVDAPVCRSIAQTLEVLDTKEESVNQIMEQEHAFVRKSFSLRERISAFLTSKQARKSKETFVAKLHRNQLERRQTMIDFAARACQLEKGKPPTAVIDLIPDYLKAIPKDPTTGTNLVLSANVY